MGGADAFRLDAAAAFASGFSAGGVGLGEQGRVRRARPPRPARGSSRPVEERVELEVARRSGGGGIVGELAA